MCSSGDKKSDDKLLLQLENNFKTVNEWLKFAEQKNASLIVLNAGIIWGVSRLFINKVNLEQLSVYLNWVGYSLSGISLLIGIISLMPILSNVWYINKDKNESDNSVYFGHIAKYTDKAYLDLLSSKIGFLRKQYTGIEYDLANQLIVNSGIAMVKFSRFKISSYLTLGSIFFFGVSSIIFFTGN